MFRGQVLPADAKVLAVFEDWKGDGAGNGEGPSMTGLWSYDVQHNVGF
jgi:hypothetical protein